MADLDPVYQYHDGTKHHVHRFARSLGYLDWASQPNPFRSFAGSPEIPLHPRPGAAATTALAGDLLRHALGLSAWKQYHESRPSTGSGRGELVEPRWSLRVNPSSGNLHPTEAYLVSGPLSGLIDTPGVYHYSADRHALEQRCAFDAAAWTQAVGDPAATLFIALTSIHWREAWKYGERAFRYCQHDLGHAIAAVRFAAALVGWRAAMLPGWSHNDIAALTGIDRDEDYVEAEREEPGCLLAVTPFSSDSRLMTDDCRLTTLAAVRGGQWSGRANQLSEDHVQWTFIDDIARATEDPGRPNIPAYPAHPAHPAHPAYPTPPALPDRSVILQRRSAVALDGRSSIDADRFFAMLAATMPSRAAPWDAVWWDAHIHLALFVHRVDGVDPGLYVLPRNAATTDRVRAALGRDFLWETVTGALPLVRLARGDCRALAQRVSCDQEIAADGFFSLGMIADFDAGLEAFGPSFYRHLFWESGIVGQALYLAAEMAGARSTGIGCFYDDPMHDVLGLSGHAFQSLYHFTVGIPVEDTRLLTKPGYAWE